MLALLERRLARAEAARRAAEALLEQKSRVLAISNEQLVAGKESLKRNLARRNRQLLDAQRVAGIGTMLWNFSAGRLELSPQIRAMFAVPQNVALTSYRPLLRKVVKDDRRKLLCWIHKRLLRGRLPSGCVACDPGAMGPRPRADIVQPLSGDGGDAETPRCRSEDFQIELRCKGTFGDAAPRWMRVMAQFEYGEDCRAALIYATVQDITRQVRADAESAALRQREQRRVENLEQMNQELIAARENALRANAAKSRFLAMMSHDIRTPLNGVIGMLSLLDEPALNDGQRRVLDLVRSSGEQLRVLLNDIIDLSRAEAGKLRLNPAPTNLAAVLTESTDFWRSLAREKNLKLDLQLAPDLPAWIEIDRVRFRHS